MQDTIHQNIIKKKIVIKFYKSFIKKIAIKNPLYFFLFFHEVFFDVETVRMIIDFNSNKICDRFPQFFFFDLFLDDEPRCFRIESGAGFI